MRKVQPANVDAGMDELFDDFVASTRRADGGNDFCLTHVVTAYNATRGDVESRRMIKIVPGTARRVLAIGADPGDGVLRPEDALAPDGMLIVMEVDSMRAEQAKRRFVAAGLEGRATVIAGDPRRMLYKLAGPFDVIFGGRADASTRDKLSALLAAGGVLVTDDDL